MIQCANCGYGNRDTAGFCRQCGKPLANAAPIVPQPQPAPLQPVWHPTPSPPVPASLFPQPARASAWLVAEDGQRFPLDPHTTIGRLPPCKIVFQDSSVSAHHATLELSGGQWQLTDNQSRNGTFVNGARILSPCLLHDSDQIKLGNVTLRFELSTTGTMLVGSQQMSSSGTTLVSSPPSVVSTVRRGLFAPKASGRVMSPPSERQDQPPTDWTRVTVSLTVTLLFLGALLTFLALAASVGAVLLCLGAGILLPLLLMLWAPVQLLIGAVMSALKDDKPVTIVNFQIEDKTSGHPIDVTLVRKRGTGEGIAHGDVVEVWGRQHSGAAITASKVHVIERKGTSTSVYVSIKNPWPWWIGVVALVAMLWTLTSIYTALGGRF